MVSLQSGVHLLYDLPQEKCIFNKPNSVSAQVNNHWTIRNLASCLKLNNIFMKIYLGYEIYNIRMGGGGDCNNSTIVQYRLT